MTPPSLHVGMLTTAFPRFAGDLVGNFVFFFCREPARRGVRVTVATPRTPGTAARETMEGVEVRRFRYLAPASLERWASKRLRGARAILAVSERMRSELDEVGHWLAAADVIPT